MEAATVAQETFGLMGFRHDSQGRVHAAFMVAPAGPYAFELPTTKRVADLPCADQEHWALQQMRKRGHLFHGLYLSNFRNSR